MADLYECWHEDDAAVDESESFGVACFNPADSQFQNTTLIESCEFAPIDLNDVDILIVPVKIQF